MSRRRKLVLGLGLLIVLLSAAFVAVRGAPRPLLRLFAWFGAPAIGGVPPMPEPAVRAEVPEVSVEVVARDLEIPWAIAFPSPDRMLFTERPGRIRSLRRREDGTWDGLRTWLDLKGAVHDGEGGLLGLAVRDGYVFAMYTARKAGGVVNRVSRFPDRGDHAGPEEVLIDDIPASRYHNGGVLAFGPDGALYVGTGDAGEPDLAQDRASLAGKVLRIRPDGTLPADNPWPGSRVWAYGFRNVTALAWHPGTGSLWAASHGPSGEFPGLFARDSVYVVRRGANHGWPLVVGVSDREDIESPLLYYPEQAVPPGGATFLGQDFFLATLRSAHLQRVVTDGDRPVRIEIWWPERFGRLRAVAVGPDGTLYFSTSNRDGRAARDYPGADFIYRIVAR